MQADIRIENATQTCTIEIEGTIGIPEAWQFDDPEARVATYAKFRDTVRRIEAIRAPEVIVHIRSTGGDVNDALLIHDALRSLPGRVVTRCYGYTASAATLIAQAASDGAREISSNALYLIHRSVCAIEGNTDQLARNLDLLRKTDERLAAIYAARSGRPAEAFAALMAENDGGGRWLSPAEAVAAGLADRIVDAPASRTKALTRLLVRNWERLLVRTGLRTPPLLPAAGRCIRMGEPLPDGALRDTALPEGSQRDDPSSCDPLSGAYRSDPQPVPEDLPRAVSDGSSGAIPEVVAGTVSDAVPDSVRAPVPGAVPPGVGPTRTDPCEDPAFTEQARTPNQQAYAEDARRITR